MELTADGVDGKSSEQAVVSVQPPPRLQPPPYSPHAHPPPVVQPPALATNAPVPGHVITVRPTLGNTPRPLTCPSCRHSIVTTVIYESSTKTHIVAGFICGITLWCFICCVAAIPYYLRCCKVAEHYCPNCNFYIGGYSTL